MMSELLRIRKSIIPLFLATSVLAYGCQDKTDKVNFVQPVPVPKLQKPKNECDTTKYLPIIHGMELKLPFGGDANRGSEQLTLTDTGESIFLKRHVMVEGDHSKSKSKISEQYRLGISQLDALKPVSYEFELPQNIDLHLIFTNPGSLLGHKLTDPYVQFEFCIPKSLILLGEDEKTI